MEKMKCRSRIENEHSITEITEARGTNIRNEQMRRVWSKFGEQEKQKVILHANCEERETIEEVEEHTYCTVTVWSWFDPWISWKSRTYGDDLGSRLSVTYRALLIPNLALFSLES
jgi:hypothetical protein